MDVAAAITRRLSKEVSRRLSLDARRRSYQVWFQITLLELEGVGNLGTCLPSSVTRW